MSGEDVIVYFGVFGENTSISDFGHGLDHARADTAAAILGKVGVRNRDRSDRRDGVAAVGCQIADVRIRA
jgi:hypothetical protein